MIPKKSKERRAELAILENEGNFKHNRKVLVSNEGCLVVGRRGSYGNKQHGVTHFLPCYVNTAENSFRRHLCTCIIKFAWS